MYAIRSYYVLHQGIPRADFVEQRIVHAEVVVGGKPEMPDPLLLVPREVGVEEFPEKPLLVPVYPAVGVHVAAVYDQPGAGLHGQGQGPLIPSAVSSYNFV